MQPAVNRLSCFCLVLMTAMATGCSTYYPGKTEYYRCDGGREFSLAQTSGDSIRLDISGMSFPLQSQASDGKGQVYACEVLTLWRDGEKAWVKMEDSSFLQNCLRRE